MIPIRGRVMGRSFVRARRRACEFVAAAALTARELVAAAAFTAVAVSVAALALPACARADGAPLSARDSAVIVLNRLAYGPRPGDIDRVAAMGVMRWVDEQLSPGSDLAREQLEDGFEIFHLDRAGLASRFLSARDERRANKADSTRREADPAMNEMKELNGEFQQLAVARAVVAESQLREVLCDFWINHFNIFLGKNDERVLLPSFVEEAIRPRVLGRFEDLLIATAESPAMMVYLDNAESVAAGAISPDRRARRDAQCHALVAARRLTAGPHAGAQSDRHQ